VETIFAQTNIQLFNQLQCQGYTKSELKLVFTTYELAKDLFSGYFIEFGRTQLAHVIGTTSILASLNAPPEVVAAGLIHNVYSTGDFGDGRRGRSEGRRRRIRQAVSDNVEKYVARFAFISSSLDKSMRARGASVDFPGIDPFDVVDRQVLLIVLAEILDHRLNFERLRNLSVPAEIARQLGFLDLADELKRAPDEAACAQFFTKANIETRNRSRLIPPPSYWRRPAVAVRQWTKRAGKPLARVIPNVAGFRSSAGAKTARGWSSLWNSR
jgi:hypothetical protein